MSPPKNQWIENAIIKSGYPSFRNLPWDIPFSNWDASNCASIVTVSTGIARHPVLFVNFDGDIYALKQMEGRSAQIEYDLLTEIEQARLPAVAPVGYIYPALHNNSSSILITHYLERSIPFRTLFVQKHLLNYRKHLLDAIAGLLVQIHLAGVYWGDCSLSNTLFRRDAGTLSAYLVDAETAEISQDFSPTMRHHELEIMEENVNAELEEIASRNIIPKDDLHSYPGAYIRLRYQALWEEVTRDEYINKGEHYRINDRIRALNSLGYSISDIELHDTDYGDQLRVRIVVSDRNFHRDQLFGLTGLDIEEGQAQIVMNEIHEFKATLSRDKGHEVPISVAAHHWLTQIYEPILGIIQSETDEQVDEAELYCHILEHKWYLSEEIKHDVGHVNAVQDYLANFPLAGRL